MLIALVGYMGSGKTTVGQLLANRLNIPCIDLDSEIEKREGKLISEIFRTQGESEFRRIESAVLQNILDEFATGIIATGGGTPCFFNQMQELNERCVTVYLECSANTLAARLSTSTQNRPMLSLIHDIDTHLQDRLPCYLSAHHIVSGEMAIEDLLVRIERIWEENNPEL